MKKYLIVILAFMAAVTGLNAQILTPITWNSSVEMNGDREGRLVFKASIDDGWHLYGINLPAGGPNATKFTFDRVEGLTLKGDITPSRAPHEQVDMVFNLKLNWWEGKIEFYQDFTLNEPNGAYLVDASVTFQGCNDGSCIPPSTENFTFKGGELSAGSTAPAAETADSETTNISTSSTTSADAKWWAPVTFENSEDTGTSIAQSSWWYIFLWGFIGGLVALLTPCVWPMIPLTVSFFLKKSNSRSRSIADALTYGGAIIVIYLILGLAITLIFGASKLNDLATNAVFNLLFFLLLVVFAISFFGAFDIKLPSKWSNSVDSKAERTTGIISIFFMAFTLALVSFSCTGPIIGTLLVEAASVGDITGPAIGMGAFALALAIPFTLFAIFPSWLKEMPRSGGWLNSVKVVLGFLELALSLKFLSVADLAYGWGILDREVFVSLWIIIFALLGMYLLGKLRFSHDGPMDYVPVGRFFLALISLSFSMYLIPGLWGAPLKSVSAFVPPLYTQDFNLYEGGTFKVFHDYDEGMTYAVENNRPVMIDFSGYGCVNCRKMEGAVFDTQEVSSIIKENFVLITLMVDDKTALEKPMEVIENGKTVKLKTVGDKWSYLQRSKFAANSQPYYVMLDGEGSPLASPYYYDENVAKFVEWLEQGLKKYSAATTL